MLYLTTFPFTNRNSTVTPEQTENGDSNTLIIPETFSHP